MIHSAIELGINFEHIWMKTQSVLIPTKPITEHILDDTDLAGPLVFCFVFGVCLLLVRDEPIYVDRRIVLITSDAPGGKSALWLHLRVWRNGMPLYVSLDEPHVAGTVH